MIRSVYVQFDWRFGLTEEVLYSIVDEVFLMLLEIVHMHTNIVKHSILGQTHWLFVECLPQFLVDGCYRQRLTTEIFKIELRFHQREIIIMLSFTDERLLISMISKYFQC
jgi:hypothetical protein